MSCDKVCKCKSDVKVVASKTLKQKVQEELKQKDKSMASIGVRNENTKGND